MYLNDEELKLSNDELLEQLKRRKKTQEDEYKLRHLNDNFYKETKAMYHQLEQLMKRDKYYGSSIIERGDSKEKLKYIHILESQVTRIKESLFNLIDFEHEISK